MRRPDRLALTPALPARRPLSGAMVLAAVLLLHGLLVWMLQQTLQAPQKQTRPPPPVVSVWIRSPPAPTVPALPEAAPAPATPVPVAPPRRRSNAPPADPALQSLTAAAAPASAAASSAAASPVTATASAPSGSLLDTEATRRAIRDVARPRSLGEMGAQASGEPAAPSADQRLGQDIARGARGDCLKGEYAGAGMGLLSLPFWLVAELQDKCRR